MTAHRRRTKRHPRHSFFFKLSAFTDDPDPKIVRHKVKVIPAEKPVKVQLTAEHVRASIKAKGLANTAMCPMAFCLRGNAKAFPHPIDHGMVDFNYASAFVISKSAANGLPRECHSYWHSQGWIAKMNDSLRGQRRLLRHIEQSGPITIELKPPHLYAYKPPKTTGDKRKRKGDRHGITGKFGNRRYAFLVAGGITVPAPTANA